MSSRRRREEEGQKERAAEGENAPPIYFSSFWPHPARVCRVWGWVFKRNDKNFFGSRPDDEFVYVYNVISAVSNPPPGAPSSVPDPSSADPSSRSALSSDCNSASVASFRWTIDLYLVAATQVEAWVLLNPEG